MDINWTLTDSSHHIYLIVKMGTELEVDIEKKN